MTLSLQRRGVSCTDAVASSEEVVHAGAVDAANAACHGDVERIICPSAFEPPHGLVIGIGERVGKDIDAHANDFKSPLDVTQIGFFSGQTAGAIDAARESCKLVASFVVALVQDQRPDIPVLRFPAQRIALVQEAPGPDDVLWNISLISHERLCTALKHSHRNIGCATFDGVFDGLSPFALLFTPLSSTCHQLCAMCRAQFNLTFAAQALPH